MDERPCGLASLFDMAAAARPSTPVAEPRFVAPTDKPTDTVIISADGTRWDVHMARLAGPSLPRRDAG